MEARKNSDAANIPPRAPGEIVSAAAVVDARRAVKAKHIVSTPSSIGDAFAVARAWVTRIPDYEIVNENANELIAWKTSGGSKLRHAGSVNLRAGSDGRTEARIELDYEPADVAFGVLFDDLTRALLKAD
ncbi:MAG: hypothetical protein JOZ54_02055 [Acidobacteria bacterium]|nr:hypothetical protein [Acidobacteriota bacterium]